MKKSTLKQLLPIIVDVLAPLLIFYVLHAFGVYDGLALALGSLAPGISTGEKLMRNRKLDQLGLFMTIILLLGVILTFITGDPRLILVKPALFVAVAALYCFASVLGKPFMMTIAKPMATEGDPVLQALWEKSWLDSVPFQRVIRNSTVVFGIALLIDATGRVIIVFNVPVGESVALANAPGIIAIAAAIIYHHKTVKPVFERLKS